MRCKLGLALVLCIVALSSRALALDVTHGTFKTSDGINIHYVEAGKGTPVVLIHGYSGSAEGTWVNNGMLEAVSKNHRAIAIDCRNHGKSDKPSPGGQGEPRDVVELMDHLKIEKAHIHGYSMGGGITQRLLTMIPGRMITATFGGSGIRETDPQWLAKVQPDKQGTDPQEAEALFKLRVRNGIANGLKQEEAEAQAKKQAESPRGARGGAAKGGTAKTDAAKTAKTDASNADAKSAKADTAKTDAAKTDAKTASAKGGAARGGLDLTKLNIPMMVVNGEFDSPNAKSTRIAREVKVHKVLVLPGKSHNTAVSAGYIPKEYIEGYVQFITANDPK